MTVMIIKRFLGFRYLRKLFRILVIFFVSCKGQIIKNVPTKEAIYVKYEGLEKDEIYNGLYLLKFKIINITEDTFYYNANKIKITCRNGAEKIENDFSKFPKNLGLGQMVIIPKKLSELEINKMRKHNEVKEYFVAKFLSNFNSKEFNYQIKKDQIIRQLIVVLPKESIEYKSVIYNESISKNNLINIKCSCELH
jgi:hypothetical protein